MPKKTEQQADVAPGRYTYKHSEALNCSIRSGSNISCGGDLLVNGVIEDCKVSVKGDLFCSCGFIGVGRGVIEAGGDVNLGHIKNQSIISSGSVRIATEAVNSSIAARKSITAATVVGGTLSANRTIVVKTAGNTHGVQTTLQINPNIKSLDELAQAEAAIEQHEADIELLVWKLENMPPDKKDDKTYVYHLKNSIITANYKLTAIQAKIKEIEGEMDKLDNSFIYIENCAYPGTIIMFGQQNILLADTVSGGSTIRLVDSQIKIT